MRSFAFIAFLAFSGASSSFADQSIEDCATRVAADRSCLLEIADDAILASNGARTPGRSIANAAARLAKEGQRAAALRLADHYLAAGHDPDSLDRFDQAMVDPETGTTEAEAWAYAASLPEGSERRKRAETILIWGHYSRSDPVRVLREYQARSAEPIHVSRAFSQAVISLVRRGRFDEAIALIDEASGLFQDAVENPLPEEVMLGGLLPLGITIGLVSVEMATAGRTDDAAALIRRHANLPNLSQGIRAEISTRVTERTAPGLRDLAEALGSDGLQQEISYKLALYHVKQDAFDQARALMSEINPGSRPHISGQIARGYLREGREADLRSIIDQADSLVGPGLWFGLAEQIARQGRLTEALAIVDDLRNKRVYKTFGLSPIYSRMADWYLDQGDLAAVHALLDARADPKERAAIVRVAVGRLFPDPNRRDRALDNLDTIMDLVRKSPMEQRRHQDVRRLLLRGLNQQNLERALALGLFPPEHKARRAPGARFNAAVAAGDWSTAERLWAARTPETRDHFEKLDPFLKRLSDAEAAALARAVEPLPRSIYRSNVTRALRARAQTFAQAGDHVAARTVESSIGRGYTSAKYARGLFEGGDVAAAVRTLADVQPDYRVDLAYRFWAIR